MSVWHSPPGFGHRFCWAGRTRLVPDDKQRGFAGMIRIKDLRVDYDDLCAVKDLSLEVGPGEVCGLIGPNGAGKTTTMRAMLGLLEPTYGEIEVCGVDVRERPKDVCRIMGFMPDFPPVYEDLHGLGVPRPVRRQLRAQSVAATARFIADHLDMVGLTESAEAMVGEALARDAAADDAGQDA